VHVGLHNVKNRGGDAMLIRIVCMPVSWALWLLVPAACCVKVLGLAARLRGLSGSPSARVCQVVEGFVSHMHLPMAR
jgi:hypothetical protein